ncbi:hypothetical protein [Vibrio sp. D431a]|uniref:hypothetical protein n=1 Tax=Vibrio sp. D431a TaxID=2837388 RepID=UPI0025523AC7|nr:hypothetical protein [Vibrio sp. D431a]MDK9789935.1 hypothetical protein [Vibrio sp. D431a]
MKIVYGKEIHLCVPEINDISSLKALKAIEKKSKSFYEGLTLRTTYKHIAMHVSFLLIALLSVKSNFGQFDLQFMIKTIVESDYEQNFVLSFIGLFFTSIGLCSTVFLFFYSKKLRDSFDRELFVSGLENNELYALGKHVLPFIDSNLLRVEVAILLVELAAERGVRIVLSQEFENIYELRANKQTLTLADDALETVFCVALKKAIGNLTEEIEK